MLEMLCDCDFVKPGGPALKPGGGPDKYPGPAGGNEFLFCAAATFQLCFQLYVVALINQLSMWSMPLSSWKMFDKDSNTFLLWEGLFTGMALEKELCLLFMPLMLFILFTPYPCDCWLMESMSIGF